MKALTLLLLRLTTGILLIIWGLVKINAPEVSASISDKYYFGLISTADLQMPLGVAQALLGAAVVLGIFRNIVYPLQAIVLGIGAAAIWQYILDPLGLYLLTEETRQLLFFPSSTVFAASLVLLAFKDEDRLSLGGMRE